jgi:hypothetical protein
LSRWERLRNDINKELDRVHNVLVKQNEMSARQEEMSAKQDEMASDLKQLLAFFLPKPT